MSPRRPARDIPSPGDRVAELRLGHGALRFMSPDDIARYRRRVYRYCLRLTLGDEGTAEDLTHEAFLAALERGLTKTGGGDDRCLAWLFRTARFFWLQRMARLKSEGSRTIDGPLERLAAPNGLEEAAIHRAIGRVRELLAPRDRRLLELVHEDRPIEIIAAELRCSVRSVQRHYAGLVDEVRRILEEGE